MKFIEKIFGKKEQEPNEIRFGELNGWIESGKNDLSYDGHATSVFSDIEDALIAIRESASELEKAEPEGRFHLKMVKIATSNRDNMVKQVSLLIENINIPKKTDVKTVFEFHENSMQTLNMCLENMMKSYNYTKMVFLEESKNVIAEVNELGRLLNRLVEPINDNKKAIDAFEKAQGSMQIINEVDSQIESEKRTIRDIEEKVDTFKKKIELNQNSLAQLAESEQWKQYLNYKNDIADLDNRAKKALSDIDILLVPLKKPFMRLRQLNEDGKYNLAPGVKKDLITCLTEPRSVSPGFFSAILNVIQNDVVAFKEEKRNLILEQIKFVGSKIGDFQKEYQTCISLINEKKEEISSMNAVIEAANIDSRIAELQDDIASAGKKIESSKKHLISLEESAAAKKQELQRIVSSIDSRKKILF